MTGILLACGMMLIEPSQAQNLRRYRSSCSFYGQNQTQADSMGCSVEQTSRRIVISWDDGYTTTLEYNSSSRQWRSLPSSSRSTVRFYSETGDVAQVEIHAGPGQGLISIDEAIRQER
ncbi:MAG: hypothetical protein ACLFM4_11305 [Phormidium sp.]